MSSARARNRRGFTLIEAMAAVVLLGIGIAGSMASIGSMTQNESKARATERMQQLAQEKLAELVATGQATVGSNGDFTDNGEPDYTWNLEVNTSGITNLDSVSLTVQRSGSTQTAKIDTLLYVPPATTATTAGATP